MIETVNLETLSLETVLVVIAGVALVASAGITVARVITGPSVLDRVVALEVLIGILICGLALEAVVTRHTTTLPILISLSLVGFVGSVSVARFLKADEPVPADDWEPGQGRPADRKGRR